MNSGDENQNSHIQSSGLAKNQSVSAAPSGWYLEQPRCESVVAGKYTLRPHWSGLGNVDEIRSIMKLAAAAPALRTEVEAIKSALGVVEWSSPEHAEDILDRLIKTYYPKLCAALALATTQETNAAASAGTA